MTDLHAGALRLCGWDELPEGSSRQFRIGELNLFVVKKGGAAYAYRNQCPHLGIELQWQADRFLDADGELIQCATHGALFLIEDGSCVAGPCRGQALRPLPCERRGEALWLLPSSELNR